MCVLPLITAAVFNSVLSLCSNLDGMMGFLRGIIIFFFVGMLVAVFCGIAAGIITSLGSEIDLVSQDILGSFVNKEEIVTEKILLRNGFDFLRMIIPHNPFSAFAEGSGLKILFFSIVMGIAFSRGNKEQIKNISAFLSELFDACIRVLNFLVLFLPFGMMFLFANQFSIITFEVINALGKFLVISILAISALILINITILKFASGKTFLETLKGVAGTLTMAFATSSGFVTMPQMLKDMEHNFKVARSGLKLVVPLGINMSPQGTCLAISIFSIFFAHMYHITLDMNVVLIIVFGAMMLSMAISGLPAIVGISLISALLEAIGVPPAVSSALLLAAFPILDPPLTMLNCIGTCTYALLLGKPVESPIRLGAIELAK
jgi:proton glutamate symport protein